MHRLWAAMLFVIASAFGCKTREEGAAKVAREAARIAEVACADAGQDENCREPICRKGCDCFADSAHLTETCIGKCMGRGVCDSDLDCTSGSTCVVIAPRVRRCAPSAERRISGEETRDD